MEPFSVLLVEVADAEFVFRVGITIVVLEIHKPDVLPIVQELRCGPTGSKLVEIWVAPEFPFNASKLLVTPVKKILKKGIPKVKGMCACCGVGNPEATKEDIDDGYNITWVYRTTCCNSEVLDENGLDVGEWS